MVLSQAVSFLYNSSKEGTSFADVQLENTDKTINVKVGGKEG